MDDNTKKKAVFGIMAASFCAAVYITYATFSGSNDSGADDLASIGVVREVEADQDQGRTVGIEKRDREMLSGRKDVKAGKKTVKDDGDGHKRKNPGRRPSKRQPKKIVPTA